ncbi:MAG TPA: EF-hand domain-containing protein [Planctomycetota bacterium]|nr:EF-hand domain-containing protein [Planctomycetota bacterium]
MRSCSLHAAGAADEPVTFNKHVAPIIFANCTGCHRDGEVAPFALNNYADAKSHAKQIARVTKSRFMPPWKAEPGYGDFHDARRLSDQQIATITKWVEQGSIEGNAADLPPAPQFKDGWSLGEPDLILKMPEAYTVPAEGKDVYRCFVLPMDIPEDKYVAAVEYRPSNRKVVHHALFFLDTTGAARRKDAQDPEPGYKSFAGPGIIPTGGLGGWAPGAFARRLSDDAGRKMNKGSDFVLQIHFHPSGKPEKEQSSVGIYFTKKTPEKVVQGFALRSRKIDIPPGEKNYKVSDTYVTPIDTQLLGITPHAHLICREMKAEATLPDGKIQPLIWIKDWDFNWQDQYLYEKPLKLPKGTKLSMEFTYDNSAENIRNPSNPPKRVTWGEQTEDEMAILFLQFVPERASDAGLMRQGMLKKLLQSLSGEGIGALSGKRGEMLKEMMNAFDKDGDGKLSDEEKAELVQKLQSAGQ